MKFKSTLALSLVAIGCFLAGWMGSAAIHRGEHAMGEFMTSFSALAYLQKSDVPAAMNILRASAEANLLEADKYGDLELWMHSRDAMNRWFARYDELRRGLPESTRGPADEGFDARLDETLRKATAASKTARQGSNP